ncbi:HAMP domain-containing protein [Leptospira selangorensis]|uniref:HAMP domain-containing protein n=1 Tax=Leptospira selangorensis TaxID=2484982 RepID=A0A5F2C848_9LEPT|nr:SpoIIE family protein phosphatase [Leptospira selangorensis]TGM12814.1 HAMP domain-containing protein [Leptospira selangorensis]TGM30875.1 HAMP domain-containing protein [Leptospira selangorensis]
MSLQLTFFSFGSLIVCIFTAVLGSFLAAIRNRSKSSSYLAGAFFLLSVHAFAFVIAYSIDSPVAAYHRWLILAVIPAFSCMGQFFFFYPSPIKEKFSFRFFSAQLFIWLTFSIYYVFCTFQKEPVFDFSEQIWTYPLPLENKILGVLVLTYSFLMIFTGIWRSWTASQESNRFTGLFVLFFSLLIFPPVIANSMSRAGIISRTDFLTVYTFFMIPGSFVILVLYINTTSDQTRFLNRITGICLGTFLLILYWIGLASVSRQEDTFDLSKLREAENSIFIKKNISGSAIVSRVGIPTKQGSNPGPRVGAPTNHNPDSDPHVGIPTNENPISPKRFLRQSTGYYDSVFPSEAERYFVEGNKEKSRSVLYKFDLENQKYEAIFPYEEYRNFLHKAIRPYFAVLFITVFVILFGFRLFFRGTIWNPLKNLLIGIGKVNQGDLNTKIQVRIQDEIGFLTDSFNGMVSSIREARTALSVYADTLEDQVKDRTSRLTKLLEQQQGDYFLTSLLLKPFGIETARNGKVSVESFTRQKKQFLFKEQNHEIGGDLCMSTSLKIGGANCTVFMNADAMGKSIQGAGGAIVLGSVFGAILNRTRLFEDKTLEFSPQRWLRSAFLELSKVFEIFEGSMLVTAVLGVIEESTGKTYLVNAEHPSPILYRNGKASLIPTKHFFNRIGLPFDPSSIFTVQSFQLKPGDCLFLGSDGKDDLIVGLREDGSKEINENQEAFLSRIEEAKGDLHKIYQGMEEYLTDDISFLKIEYSYSKEPLRTNGQPTMFVSKEIN